MDNFSYMQIWTQGSGFAGFVTRYSDPAIRTPFFLASDDGKHWEWTRLAAIASGHYQISASAPGVIGTVMNYHPDGKPGPGLNWRTNLYYMETHDKGKSWFSAQGKKLELPLTTVKNDALIYDFEAEGLNVYLKDMLYDEDGRPVILVVTSKGWEPGPVNNPRLWTVVRWNGEEWKLFPVTTSDNNYDSGCIHIKDNGELRIIGPTQVGPQPFNPGGEMAMWVSYNGSKSWRMSCEMTRGSTRNHNYIRRPVNAHPDFYGFWADGHGRKPSVSRLYFCDRAGNVYRLPECMKKETAYPKLVSGC